MAETQFFNRDLSWLSFNQRILEEAGKKSVPLLERINFLAIYSSNLDEFYRVRMPVLSAIKKINNDPEIDITIEKDVYKDAKNIIQKNLECLGKILIKDIIPEFKENKVYLVYNEAVPEAILSQTENHFFSKLAAFIEITFIDKSSNFFPANGQLYFLLALKKDNEEKLAIINIPSNRISRFYLTRANDFGYLVFIDDIIRQNLKYIFPEHLVTGAYSFKVTRNADLDLENEYEGDLAKKIEEQIRQRDYGLASRMLYQPDTPDGLLNILLKIFNLPKASAMAGGNYHNLSDLTKLPIKEKAWQYVAQPAILYPFQTQTHSLFSEIGYHDILINTPYESYDTILRFFNEAAIDKNVEEIYTTIYRVATESKILQALMSAAKNGKKVTVFVELKARFDEANNLKWAKQMREAGIKVLYSIPNLKVHAKVALIKRKVMDHSRYLGLFSTGNLNETTSAVYADHILLTAHQAMLHDLAKVFTFLTKRKSKNSGVNLSFKHLLVAQFNLADEFIKLMENEIANAKQGLPAAITIKLNNLEEKTMINKLYEASNAGITIKLIVRSICRLVPGVEGMSENISVRRIVDRYLEHSRVFIFHNNGNEKVYMGSADWMNRNIHSRIEVCFPVYQKKLKQEIKDIINIQLQDDTSAVMLDHNLQNVCIDHKKAIRAQESIYHYCKEKYRLRQNNE